MRSAELPTQPVLAPSVAAEHVIVAIPTLNEAQAIEVCLRSLLSPRGWIDRVRVVVADGGSRDRTRWIVRRLMAEFPNLTLIANPHRLQSAGINRVVAEMATPAHRILVRCDAHAVYPPGYVRDVVQSLSQNGAAALATVMDARGADGFAAAAAAIVDTPLGSGGAAHRGGRRSGAVDHGHHAGMRLDWFRRIGGYDPGFSHNEDAEFDLRLRAAGGTIWLDAGIRLHYAMRPDPSALARQYWRYGRGRAATLLKHRTWPRLRQMLPAAHVGLLAGSRALAPLSWLGLVWPVLYLGLCMGASLWAMGRLRRTAGLWAGPALALMHSCWGAGYLSRLAAAALSVTRPGSPEVQSQ
ncbi:MAG: glycosyltransferase family 2 protein [Pseudomonadota bacterium]